VTDVGEECPPDENDFLQKEHLKNVHSRTKPALLSGILQVRDKKNLTFKYVRGYG
jgi:hypothetical protein